MMHRTQAVFIVGLAFLLMLSSLVCSVGGLLPQRTVQVDREKVGEEMATPTPEKEEPTPTEKPLATATPRPAEPTLTPQGPSSDQEPLDTAQIPELKVNTLDPRSEGLGHLGTFRQRMTVKFSAVESDYSGVYHYGAEVNTADQAVHVTLRVEGTATRLLPANQVQAIWIGPRLWFKVGKQPWLPVPQEVAELQFAEMMFAAGDFLPYVPTFQRVKPDEVINGILSAHYTYDDPHLPAQYGTVSGHGDVYVAVDGGYVVRYTLEGSGTFEQYFEGDGTLHLVYDTYDVGANIQIKPPRR